jgi:hypothetical protein
MTRIRFLPLILLAGLVLTGCPASTPSTSTPAAPLSPQAQVNVLNAEKLLADAINGAAKAVIQLRDQGKVSQADTTIVENYCVIAAKFSDGLDTSVTDNDIWSIQRGKIITLVQNTVLPVIGANVSPAAAAVLAQVATLLAQVKVQVGL